MAIFLEILPNEVAIFTRWLPFILPVHIVVSSWMAMNVFLNVLTIQWKIKPTLREVLGAHLFLICHLYLYFNY